MANEVPTHVYNYWHFRSFGVEMMTAQLFFRSLLGFPKGSSSWITGGLQVQKAMVLIYNGDEKYFLKKSPLKRVFPRILTYGMFEVLKCLVRTTGRGSLKT